MYKRNRYKKLQTKNVSFLNVTSLRNNGSPEAGVSCLIHSGAQHLFIFLFGLWNLRGVRQGWQAMVVRIRLGRISRPGAESLELSYCIARARAPVVIIFQP